MVGRGWCGVLTVQPSNKSFRTKVTLAKASRQNRYVFDVVAARGVLLRERC